MKELTIEEKAKRYDEAIEQLRTMMPNWENLSYNGKTFLQDLVHIIPELKESDDERIKRVIKQVLSESTTEKDECYLDNGVTQQEVFAWLERQGEQANFCNKIQIGDKVTRNEDGVLVNLSQLNRVAKKDEKQGETFTKKDVDDAYLKGICDAKHELEKQGEQKLDENLQKVISEHNAIFKSVIENYKDSKTFKNLLANLQNWWDNTRRHLNAICCEQKPAWSEEDINMFGSILSTLGICANNPQIPADVRSIHKKEESWFNELYHRVQPKQEWSEEDEQFKIERKAILNDVIAHLRFLASIEKNKVSLSFIQRDIDWIKENLPFLRPQSQWKPSDEQMLAINTAINIFGKDTLTRKCLIELHEQLKKLMFE